MPAYVIIHPAGQRRDDLVLQDEPLTIEFNGGWAIFSDGNGICTAIPAALGARIERVDEPQDTGDQEPAPAKE